MSRILLLSKDFVDSSMAGPGIRYFQMAKTLAKKLPGNQITLAAPNKTNMQEKEFTTVFYNRTSCFRLISSNDIIISQGFSFELLPFLFFLNKKVILDFYDPWQMQFLEHTKNFLPFRRTLEYNLGMQHLKLHLLISNFIVCANSRQRDLWIGMLSDLGILSASMYDANPTLKNVIDEVPYGIRPDSLKKEKQVLKGVWKGIEKDDKVIIWNGGIWNWFDPLTLIEVMGDLYKKRKDVKLFFLGTKHPNPIVKEMEMLNNTVELSKNLNLYDKNIFFNFGWMPYNETKEYLLESDIGVVTYFNNLETRYSFRTRILDLLWAEIPVVCTRGDCLSEYIEKFTLGIVIDERDRKALNEAIDKLIDDKQFYEKCKENIKGFKNTFTWEKNLQPIIKFCQNESFNIKMSKPYFNFVGLFFIHVINRFFFRLINLYLTLFERIKHIHKPRKNLNL